MSGCGRIRPAGQHCPMGRHGLAWQETPAVLRGFAAARGALQRWLPLQRGRLRPVQRVMAKRQTVCRAATIAIRQHQSNLLVTDAHRNSRENSSWRHRATPERSSRESPQSRRESPRTATALWHGEGGFVIQHTRASESCERSLGLRTMGRPHGPLPSHFLFPPSPTVPVHHPSLPRPFESYLFW